MTDEAGILAELESDTGTGGSPDPRLRKIRRRFQRCVEWEAYWRPLFIDDVKFANGDSDNGWQWPQGLRRQRDVSARPCLTMNATRVHNKQITNKMLRNKAGVKIVGAGNGATEESAQMLQALIERIQYQSDAQSAFELGRDFQVEGGIGYWRLATEYVSDESYDQEIFILPIIDPLSVYLDPGIRQKNGSDARFGFVFDNVPKEEFREAYPKFANKASLAPLGVGSGADDWLTDKEVRVCEYFELVSEPDELVSFRSKDSAVRTSVRKSQLPGDIYRSIRQMEGTRTREVWETKCNWMLIVGDEIIDETQWLGKFIPIVRCVGEERVIEGRMDRKGHTRYMKDPQRMLNFNASASVEFGALQTRAPFTGAAQAIENYEDYWNTANTDNHSYLPFNHLDTDGNPLPPQALPRRNDPPQTSPVFETGMQTAINQMMMTSGQFQNQLGMMGNERTGVAIERRQDQGDTATFHFQNNFDSAIVFTGLQLVDLMPKIYDTKRVLRAQADDGQEFDVEIDPTAKRAYVQQLGQNQEVVRRVFNPQLGKYDVRAVPGQAFGSRREETVQALTLILTQAPGLTGVIGDLLLSAMDFKEAKEAAVRLKRMVPPQAMGAAPLQQEQAMQQEIASLQEALRVALGKLGKEQIRMTDKAELREIETYRAQTDRMKALADAASPEEFHQVINDLVKEAAETHLLPMLQSSAEAKKPVGEPSGGGGALPGIDVEPPMPGAQKAPDGEWYLRDPTRRGKYLKLAPLAEKRMPLAEHPGSQT